MGLKIKKKCKKRCYELKEQRKYNKKDGVETKLKQHTIQNSKDDTNNGMIVSNNSQIRCH